MLQNSQEIMSEKDQHQVYLLLGANLGNPVEQFSRAKSLIARTVGHISKESSQYVSPFWGDAGVQPDYLNQAIEVTTTLEPLALLEEVLAIETRLGRTRVIKWGARLIDIDILFIDDLVINEPRLKVPHPLFQMRNFAMKPMMELVPDLLHPVWQLTVSKLLERSPDRSPVELFRRI